jgi:Icc-related predicted phosphoesterase
VSARIAAVGDLHVGPDSAGAYGPALARANEDADVLLLAGDLTRVGTVEEAEVLVGELAGVEIPVYAVLGNHDYEADEVEKVSEVLIDAGVQLLEGRACVLDCGGTRIGIAGVKGFGGGFIGASGSDFGEPEMKAYIAHTRLVAGRLSRALESLVGACDAVVALLHYSPVPDTLVGERLEVYPWLGSYLLAEAVDAVGADVVFHGHAHNGTEHGMTPRGIPVRNVALPLIRDPYRVVVLGD